MSYLNKLNIHNLRNIDDLSLSLSPNYNFFYGNNGGGKTSLLEAIYLLANGKSFRSHLKSRIISHQQSEMTIFAEIQQPVDNKNIKIGFSKVTEGRARLKINGEPCRSLAMAMKLLPVLQIDPSSYGLLENGPKERREYLDWGLFHVEQSFYEVAIEFQRCLKQRNAALKAQASKMTCQTWDVELSRLAKELTGLRIDYFSRLTPYFIQLLEKLDFNISINSQYYQGWPENLPLEEALQQNFTKDFSIGYTSVGPQKANIFHTVNQIPAEDILSRGQMKLAVSAMQFAQGKLYTELTKSHCIYLIDDLASELDNENREKLFILLKSLQGQFFITATDKAAFSLSTNGEYKMFHVKQGQVTPS